jgi:hypothetical protein
MHGKKLNGTKPVLPCKNTFTNLLYIHKEINEIIPINVYRFSIIVNLNCSVKYVWCSTSSHGCTLGPHKWCWNHKTFISKWTVDLGIFDLRSCTGCRRVASRGDTFQYWILGWELSNCRLNWFWPSQVPNHSLETFWEVDLKVNNM